MNLDDLKKELETSLLITKWSPSKGELTLIASRLKDFDGEPTRSNISKIVLGVIDSYEAITLEGVDNSDLSTLLLLATKVAPTDD